MQLSCSFNNAIKKWAKNLNGQFYKEDIQTAKRHTKRSSTIIGHYRPLHPIIAEYTSLSSVHKTLRDHMMSHKTNLNEFENNQVETIYKLTIMEINFKKDT